MSVPSPGSSKGRPVRSPARLGATRQLVADTSSAKRSMHNGMLIVRVSGPMRASSRAIPPYATMCRIGCPALSPHQTASHSMGLLWYGRAARCSPPKASLVVCLELRTDLATNKGKLPWGSDHGHQSRSHLSGSLHPGTWRITTRALCMPTVWSDSQIAARTRTQSRQIIPHGCVWNQRSPGGDKRQGGSGPLGGGSFSAYAARRSVRGSNARTASRCFCTCHA